MKVRPKAVLERGAAADLWRNTLSRIPTVFGRLVYLASVRDLNTGKYEHHGLATVHGALETDRILRRSHRETFDQWLAYPLKQKKADLDAYLSELLGSRRQILDTWVRLGPYKYLVPVNSDAAERALYEADLRAILKLLMNEYGVAWPETIA